jgi:hypothetical protein
MAEASRGTRRGRQPFKPQTVLLRSQRPPRVGTNSGEASTLKEWF